MFEPTRGEDELTIGFSASLENIDRAVEASKEFICDCGLEQQCFKALLVARELLSNAVGHGSGFDENKNITYTVRRDINKLVIEVADEGAGFNWKGLCKTPPEPEATCGRGLPIISAYCDDLAFNDKGNQVHCSLSLVPPEKK